MAFCPHAEDFDKDRQEILDRLEACIAPRKQLHELEWELRKRLEEVRDLQKVPTPASTHPSAMHGVSTTTLAGDHAPRAVLRPS